MFMKKNRGGSLLDFSGVLVDLARTGSREFLLKLDPSPLLTFLGRDPAVIGNLAGGWEALSDRVVSSALATRHRLVLGKQDLPAQVDWISMTVRGLGGAGALQTDVGVDPGYLGGLVDSDISLRTINQAAGFAKDGAMDLRVVTGAFGWFQTSCLLEWVDERCVALPRAQAQELLRAFAPMMIVILQAQVDHINAKAGVAAARGDATAQAAAAEEQARLAELLADYHAGKPVSHQELLDLARAHASAALDESLGQKPKMAKTARAHKTKTSKSKSSGQ